jgi:hypothetical protein
MVPYFQIFPTSIRNTASGSAFTLGRGIQFFTPVIIDIIVTKILPGRRNFPGCTVCTVYWNLDMDISRNQGPRIGRIGRIKVLFVDQQP